MNSNFFIAAIIICSLLSCNKQMDDSQYIKAVEEVNNLVYEETLKIIALAEAAQKIDPRPQTQDLFQKIYQLDIEISSLIYKIKLDSIQDLALMADRVLQKNINLVADNNYQRELKNYYFRRKPYSGEIIPTVAINDLRLFQLELTKYFGSNLNISDFRIYQCQAMFKIDNLNYLAITKVGDSGSTQDSIKVNSVVFNGDPIHPKNFFSQYKANLLGVIIKNEDTITKRQGFYCFNYYRDGKINEYRYLDGSCFEIEE